MSESLQVKICGLTRPEDAALAAELGASFLGFIFYPESPRKVTIEEYREFRDGLPALPRIYVQVCPEPDELRRAMDEGFDFFQPHFPAEENLRTVEAWADIVSPRRLWLAPRVAPEERFPEELVGFAETFLIDTYRPGTFGGTGHTGDWSGFRKRMERFPAKRWVLAGGLKPENVEEAIHTSGASVIDVGSGIEAGPGKKDPSRMRELFAALASKRSP